MIKCRTGFNPCGIFYGLIGRGGEMGVENKEGSILWFSNDFLLMNQIDDILSK